ncbi:MAG TPA: glycoside hydrolase family 2 TIM barrel-domain containing protein [Chthonomonadaceae bacterium]|nr:glycoside hydrolase family 2 TIM barrel-domain containing protein [Chthonomonadaceae bacterium]
MSLTSVFHKLAAISTSVLIALAALSSSARSQSSVPVPVKLVRTANGWQLLRNGQPYFIKGAGGSGSLDRLKAAGANSVRTWGADHLEPLLDEAQKRGMTVTVGIWLGQERQGFHYHDPRQVAEQTERVRQAILRYKDDPAVLLWGLGNEMEGSGDDPAIWTAVNDLAGMVKQLDPNHPTMTVIAEIGPGGSKLKNLDRYCPNIDIVGINSYAGAASLAQRYKEAGGTKPYIVTEFGPPGTWEVGKTSWGAVLEPTSTEKAASYRRSWEKAIAHEPLCLGGYAFLWGHKQESTATWFGMLLPDGRKVGAVDAMTEVWTGKPAENLCPILRSLILEGPDQVPPGSIVRAKLDASDPQGGPLTVQWILQQETKHVFTGGDPQPTPATDTNAILQADSQGAQVRLPQEPGAYRLFVYVYNDKGGAATANIPLRVRVPAQTP